MKIKPHSLLFSLYSLLFFLTPLIFTPFTDELFEFPKMIFAYAMMLAIFVVYGAKIITTQKLTITKTPITLPFILIALVTILATVFSTHPATSYYGYYSRFNGNILSILGYISISYIFLQEFNAQETKEIIKILLISATIVSFGGILQKLGVDKDYWVQHSWERVFSTLGQPNWLASFLVMLLPINFVLFSRELKTIRKTKHYLSLFFLFVSCLLISSALLFTRSASGYLALIFLPIILFVILLTFQPPKVKWATLGLLLIFILSCSFILYSDPETYLSLATKETNGIRLITWKATVI